MLASFFFDKDSPYAIFSNMAKQQKRTRKVKQQEKQLSPEELSKYVPANPIPKIQEVIGLGLESTFDLAKQSGASIIGSVPNTSQTIPQIK